MRAVRFVIGVLIVFVVLVRSVWVASAALVQGYEIRRLREEEAELRNRNDLLAADVARRSTVQALEERARSLGLDDLTDEHVPMLEIAPDDGAGLPAD